MKFLRIISGCPEGRGNGTFLFWLCFCIAKNALRRFPAEGVFCVSEFSSLIIADGCEEVVAIPAGLYLTDAGDLQQLVHRFRRFFCHIGKRGVGAEAPTRNKLYPAMYELGPEQFTFEILEECDKSLLDSREDYW